MAPTKDKARTKKASGDDAEQLIMDYLRKQNRPYSATDVSANLHNRVTKSAATKILKDLHERHAIEARASGKQLVYHATQPGADAAAASPSELASLDARAAALRDQTAALKAQHATLRAALHALESAMPAAALRDAVARLEREHADLAARLEALRRGGGTPRVSAADREAADRELRWWASAEKARRRIVGEMWATIADVAGQCGKDVGALKEDLGITI